MTIIINYLGQAGFLLELSGVRLMIDPYLSNYVVTSGIGDASLFSREFPAPVDPQGLGKIDAIFVTHDHADHCDPDTILPILTHNPDCIIIGPQPVLDHLQILGINPRNLLLARVFSKSTLASIRYTALPSAHYELDQDPITGEFPNLGFVFECGRLALYHSGDTILYDSLVESLRKISSHYDICCLPVNGRDAKREALGMIGNLQPEEALQLADSLKAKTIIPMHNDLFKINRLDPQRMNNHAKVHYPKIKVRWLAPGEILNL